jgi:hypothetical protein
MLNTPEAHVRNYVYKLKGRAQKLRDGRSTVLGVEKTLAGVHRAVAYSQLIEDKEKREWRQEQIIQFASEIEALRGLAKEKKS